MPDMETFFASAEEHGETWKERKRAGKAEFVDEDDDEDATARVRERRGRRVKLMVTALLVIPGQEEVASVNRPFFAAALCHFRRGGLRIPTDGYERRTLGSSDQ